MKNMKINVLLNLMFKSGILLRVEKETLHIWNGKTGELESYWQKLCLEHKDELCDHFGVKHF